MWAIDLNQLDSVLVKKTPSQTNEVDPKLQNKSGWWFGTWILFFHILGIIIPTDFHIFQRDWNHQPEMINKGQEVQDVQAFQWSEYIEKQHQHLQ